MKMLNPTAAADATKAKLAARVPTIDGKVVGFLRNEWNSLLVTMKYFEQQLKDKEGVPEIVWKKKVGARATPPQVLDELAAKCDAVVVGMGG